MPARLPALDFGGLDLVGQFQQGQRHRANMDAANSEEQTAQTISKARRAFQANPDMDLAEAARLFTSAGDRESLSLIRGQQDREYNRGRNKVTDDRAARNDRWAVEDRQRAGYERNTAAVREQFERDKEAAGRRRQIDFASKKLDKSPEEVEFLMDQGLLDDLFKSTIPDKTKPKQIDGFGLPVGSADSNQMNMLLRQGVDEQAALGIVSGRNVVSVNPQNGERVLIDKATNQIVPLKQPQTTEQNDTVQQDPRQSQGPTDPGLFSMADEGTGIVAGAKTVLSDTLGQTPGSIGEATTFPDAVEAEQEFNLFKRDLIRSLSLNPRFPIAEQKRIENLLPRGALTSPATLKQALKSLDREMARIEKELLHSSQDSSTPVGVRASDSRTLNEVRAARRRINIPKDKPRSDLENKYGLE